MKYLKRHVPLPAHACVARFEPRMERLVPRATFQPRLFWAKGKEKGNRQGKEGRLHTHPQHLAPVGSAHHSTSASGGLHHLSAPQTSSNFAFLWEGRKAFTHNLP